VNEIARSEGSAHQPAHAHWLQFFLALFALSAAWIGGFCVVTASRVFASMYHSLGLGADFPLPTAVTFDASRNHIPWAFAVLATVLLVYLLVRASRYLIVACAAISTLGMIAVSFAALSLAIPNYSLCAGVVLWPDWPDWNTATSRATNVVSPSSPHPDARQKSRIHDCTVDPD
jgi:hypothetical protein